MFISSGQLSTMVLPLFDTAEAYGPFESERILGEGIAPFRTKLLSKRSSLEHRPKTVSVSRFEQSPEPSRR
jgi:aryl-alcohol dehydrogenase-like predicted oxidoreductase